mmetsp:Transcript_18569/g.42910  ORF Transcript_18569/g.42910 Transcript_18569/m.42910 type:complete len:219 (-) Transcript_18569:224-880(-)
MDMDNSNNSNRKEFRLTVVGASDKKARATAVDTGSNNSNKRRQAVGDREADTGSSSSSNNSSSLNPVVFRNTGAVPSDRNPSPTEEVAADTDMDNHNNNKRQPTPAHHPSPTLASPSNRRSPMIPARHPLRTMDSNSNNKPAMNMIIIPILKPMDIMTATITTVGVVVDCLRWEVRAKTRGHDGVLLKSYRFEIDGSKNAIRILILEKSRSTKRNKKN